MAEKLKCWKKTKYTGNIPSWTKKDYGENIWIVKDFDGYHFVKDFEGSVNKFKLKSQALKFANKYMKEHDKC